jgi:predicted nucleic acid-binding protein
MTRTSPTILPDTSAWGELYRQTGSHVHLAMIGLLGDRARLAITEPVVMELLSARRPIRQLASVRRRLLSLTMLRVGGLETYERAAAIQRACRAQGETIRSSIDCLIATVAIREGATVLAADRDFDVIARHTDLRLHLA